MSSDVEPIIFNPETANDLLDRIFYGLKYEPNTGLAYFERIESGEVIELPVLTAGLTYEVSDYVAWLASIKYLNFSFETALSSNLIMEVA